MNSDRAITEQLKLDKLQACILDYTLPHIENTDPENVSLAIAVGIEKIQSIIDNGALENHKWITNLIMKRLMGLNM